MKVSYSWLNELVDVKDIPAEEVAKKLTFAGVEVEEISTAANGSNLVIGKILSCVAHPDSDHLHVLEVDEGKYGVHQIVCGAPNARAGLKVIVARTGAKLPGGTIEPSKIRGVESDGMCCSLLELGVDKKYLTEYQLAGIEELSEDAPVGEDDVLGYLGLDDQILDLSLLANRSDLNAMENVAKEAGTLLRRPIHFKEMKDYGEKDEPFEVTSTSPNCPLFTARLAYGVKVGPSPKWMKRILEAEGVRSINNVVDIGNYVMLLTGQPINMYDLDKMKARSLIVKDDFEGDFLAMDDNTYRLEKGDLLVTSGGVGGCLAGIMTSKGCEVDENSKNIAVEAAYFHGATIRRTSRRLGLSSESSARFEKGINASQMEHVQIVTTALLKEIASAKRISKTFVYDEMSHEEKVVETSLDYINKRLGTSFEFETVKETLLADHMGVEGDAKCFLVKVPAHRIDIGGEADISEEVIRLLGFENIQSKLPEASYDLSGGFTEEQKGKLAIRRFLRNHGVSETVTYSLVSKDEKDAFAYLRKEENYHLLNPMTDDREYLRKAVLPSLLNVASYNVAHQEKDLALYEISDIDVVGAKGRHLALVLVGAEELQGTWRTRPYDFYSAKGYFQGIMDLLGINANRYKFERLPETKEEFHPGRSAGVYLGRQLIGVMGELHPKALKKYGLGKNAVAMELDLSAFLSMKVSPQKASIPSKYPSVSRDLAFILDEGISYEEVRRELLKTSKLLKEVSLFDLYQGENIAPGKKSMAVSLRFLDESKTLKDEEVAEAMEKAMAALEMRFAAEVRKG